MGTAQELTIVDADGHYVEDPDGWAAHLTAADRDRFGPRLHVDDEGIEHFTIGDLYSLPARGQNLMAGLGLGDGMSPRPADGGPPERRGRRLHEGAAGGLDPKARLDLMDEEGIAVSVLYPTLALGSLPSLTDASVANALGRALNDWAAETWSGTDDARLVPVATLPLHDPQWAADELRRCVEDLGMPAGWVSPVPVMGRTIDSPEHDVVWERAAELAVPITTHHGSGGGSVRAVGADRNQTWLGKHAMGHPFEAMTAIVSLYTSRVFQRYDTLRWGFFEAGTGWLPWWLEQIEEHAERMSWLIPDMDETEDIEEIFLDRCVVTGEGEDEFVGAAMDAIGDDSVLWASDFPHFDCTYPGLTRELRERDDLSDERRELLASRNALAFFGVSLPEPA